MLDVTHSVRSLTEIEWMIENLGFTVHSHAVLQARPLRLSHSSDFESASGHSAHERELV
jgi:hypothetical protein